MMLKVIYGLLLTGQTKKLFEKLAGIKSSSLDVIEVGFTLHRNANPGAISLTALEEINKNLTEEQRKEFDEGIQESLPPEVLKLAGTPDIHVITTSEKTEVVVKKGNYPGSEKPIDNIQ